MYEAGVLQPWVSSVVVDIMLILGNSLYLGVDQSAGMDCQENSRHMNVLITFVSTSEKCGSDIYP